MNKEVIYENIFKLINEGFFLDKYIELTTPSCIEEFDWRAFDDTDISLDIDLDEESDQIMLDSDCNKLSDEIKIKHLEDVAAKLFNAILIGCQLFDDEERIKKFVDLFSRHLDAYSLEKFLADFGINSQEALDRLKHGFGVHFTTPNICSEIQKSGKLHCYGTNTLFTKEEAMILKEAVIEQKEQNPNAEQKLNYLFTGWGVGVSSYSSLTNGFWMFHTPESLSFLYGDISNRNKEEAMGFVLKNISDLSEENRHKVFITLSDIYDRLIGEEQAVGCILIDRDAFEYEVDYYYDTGAPVGVERRPYSQNFSSIMSNDCKINQDIDVGNLKMLKIPTITELERQKRERLQTIRTS